MTGIWETADTITKARMNEKTIFQGTGSAISGLASTYSGMLAYCTSTGSGFTIDTLYVRNTANTSWTALDIDSLFGDGSDGDVTISSNTDLGSSNKKNYNNLTINSGVYLTGNSPLIIRVSGVLTFASGTSIIKADGKGGAGGVNADGGSGGNGGGQVSIFANTISGTGKVSSNGTDGGDVSGNAAGETASVAGTGGYMAGSVNSASGGSAGLDVNDNRGGGGGAMAGNGGNGDTASGGTAHTTLPSNTLEARYDGGGGGSAYHRGAVKKGGGGAGSGGFVRIYSVNNIPAVTLEAIGGIGGDSDTCAGGGGSGGIIWVFTLGTDSSTKSVTGGAAGTGGTPTAGSSGVTRSVIG